MKPEEAKKYLEIIVGDWSMEFVIGPMRTEVLKKAIDALEKQVPKKIEYISDGDADGSPVWEDRCPVCEAELDGRNYLAYCPYCGQAIDWDDDDTE